MNKKLTILTAFLLSTSSAYSEVDIELKGGSTYLIYRTPLSVADEGKELAKGKVNEFRNITASLDAKYMIKDNAYIVLKISGNYDILKDLKEEIKQVGAVLKTKALSDAQRTFISLSPMIGFKHDFNVKVRKFLLTICPTVNLGLAFDLTNHEVYGPIKHTIKKNLLNPAINAGCAVEMGNGQLEGTVNYLSLDHTVSADESLLNVDAAEHKTLTSKYQRLGFSLTIGYRISDIY